MVLIYYIEIKNAMKDTDFEKKIELDILEREKREEIIDTYVPIENNKDRLTSKSILEYPLPIINFKPSENHLQKIEASLPKYNCPRCRSHNGYDNSLHFKCNDCNFIYNSYF